MEYSPFYYYPVPFIKLPSWAIPFANNENMGAFQSHQVESTTENTWVWAAVDFMHLQSGMFKRFPQVRNVSVEHKEAARLKLWVITHPALKRTSFGFIYLFTIFISCLPPSLGEIKKVYNRTEMVIKNTSKRNIYFLKKYIKNST